MAGGLDAGVASLLRSTPDMNCSGAVLKAEEESHQWQRLVVHSQATNISLNKPIFATGRGKK
jgi:hypothetical protein